MEFAGLAAKKLGGSRASTSRLGGTPAGHRPVVPSCTDVDAPVQDTRTASIRLRFDRRGDETRVTYPAARRPAQDTVTARHDRLYPFYRSNQPTFQPAALARPRVEIAVDTHPLPSEAARRDPAASIRAPSQACLSAESPRRRWPRGRVGGGVPRFGVRGRAGGGFFGRSDVERVIWI